MCVTSPSRRPLLTGNGRSFSSFSGFLVYQSALSPVLSSLETMALPERERALWRCGQTALQSRSSSTIRNTSINVPKSNFELNNRHTHVTRHIDESRLTAAPPTLSVLKGVLNPLMAQQSDTEQETAAVLWKPRRSGRLVALGPKINKRRVWHQAWIFWAVLGGLTSFMCCKILSKSDISILGGGGQRAGARVDIHTVNVSSYTLRLVVSVCDR